MSSVPLASPCTAWHISTEAIAAVCQLGPNDVRLILVRGIPGPDCLEWHPDSDHGAAIFARLAAIHHAAVGAAFADAIDDQARSAALTVAQCAPTVSVAVASRFCDPARWCGFGAVEATRRFRANWR